MRKLLALLMLACAASPAFAQNASNVQPIVVNGTDANGGLTTCIVGTVATGTCPLPIVGGSGGSNINVNNHDAAGNNETSTAGAADVNIKSSSISNQTVVIGPSSAAGSAIAPGVAGSASSSTVLKAGTGNLYSVYWTAGSTQGWGMVFNATAAPSNGATTAGIASGNLQDCIYVPANSTVSINYAPGPLELFSTGITAAFSSTACSSLTLSATAYIHGSAQ